jgi:lipid-A-disaccharide synthase-like uncharacterized protein
MGSEITTQAGFAVGIVAAVLFYGSFYVQWIASEIQKRSVVPVAFWYMRSAGSLLLLLFGFLTRSPNGTLSHCFNSFIYMRNLVHIWRGKNRLSRAGYIALHLGVAVIIVTGVAMTAWTWWGKIHDTRTTVDPDAARTWFWIGVGTVAQGLFAARFILQWILSERRRESVIPTAFWYISLAATLLLISAHVNQGEWVYGVGLCTTLVVYARNIWLIHHGGHPSEEAPVSSEKPAGSLE